MKIDSLKNSVQGNSVKSLGLYIHIPFCRVKCQFCAFYVELKKEKHVEAFLDCVDQEIQLYGREVGLGYIPVTTVYFGGGTPTALSARQLTHLLEKIQETFSVAPDAEISIEAHPGTIDAKKLEGLRSRGFNRISIGAQSFDDQELLQLGGRSVSKTTQIAIESARKAGFQNISVDLMYGFPGHSSESWLRTLDATITLQPTHLSCYAFTIEEGSQFHHQVAHGLSSPLDEASQVQLANITGDFLESAGYAQYEISNFCHSGMACQHNLRYWQGESYLGFGPSAQSFISHTRFGNNVDLESYCIALTQGELPVDQLEILNSQQRQREQIVFGLRMNQGVRDALVESVTQVDSDWAKTFYGMKEQGLLSEHEGYMRLTNKGRLFADTVAVALL